jgi:hypothetical protein
MGAAPRAHALVLDPDELASTCPGWWDVLAAGPATRLQDGSARIPHTGRPFASIRPGALHRWPAGSVIPAASAVAVSGWRRRWAHRVRRDAGWPAPGARRAGAGLCSGRHGPLPVRPSLVDALVEGIRGRRREHIAPVLRLPNGRHRPDGAVRPGVGWVARADSNRRYRLARDQRSPTRWPAEVRLRCQALISRQAAGMYQAQRPTCRWMHAAGTSGRGA